MHCKTNGKRGERAWRKESDGLWPRSEIEGSVTHASWYELREWNIVYTTAWGVAKRALGCLAFKRHSAKLRQRIVASSTWSLVKVDGAARRVCSASALHVHIRLYCWRAIDCLGINRLSSEPLCPTKRRNGGTYWYYNSAHWHLLTALHLSPKFAFNKALDRTHVLLLFCSYSDINHCTVQLRHLSYHHYLY